MGKKLWLFLACMLMTASMAFAQKKATGVVLDGDTGEPLVGAAVKIQGTTTGVLTDANGKFTLSNIPAKAKTLVVSFMGMKSTEVAIRPNLTVTLASDVKSMDQVMVIAYGQQKRSAFTGSAAVVNSEDIEKVEVTNAVDALKGKAAGVQINTASGQPGETPTIRIRGFNSLVAGQSPLLVVDGSPYDGSINDITPSDVESMTVLKDAASTALYGARGGNGVIIITTKQGKRHKDAEITFDAKWGVNMKGNRDYDVIDDPAGYYETYYKGLYNYATNDLGKSASAAWQWANKNLIDRTEGFGLGYNVYNVPQGQAMIGTNGKLNPAATLGNLVYGKDGKTQYYLIPDNWDDEIYHKGLRQQYTVSASGASDKGTYYASVDYLNNEGITYASEYERFTARLKADYMLKKWLKLSGNVSYGHYNRAYLNDEGDSSTGNIFALHNIAPIYPVYMRDANGNILYNQDAGINAYDYGDATSELGISRPYLGQANPISDLLVNTSKYTGNSFNGTGTIDLYLPLGFTVTSINSAYLHERSYTSITNPYFGQYKSSNGIISKEATRDFNLNFQQRIDWHKDFNKHDIEVMAGHEYYRVRSYDLYGNKHNMFSQDDLELNGAVVVDDTGSSMSEYNTESWLLRGMYNFDERYYVQASVMRQASSAFHPDHRWGTFWSASLGWMLSKEKFFKAKWVDELKLKASIGQNGNDFGLNGYYYTNRYTVTNSNDNVSLVPSTLGKNENFSWEKSTKFNTGIDFSLFKDRLYGSLEYYANYTSGLISSVPYAPSFGYTSYYENVGNMSNKGYELDLHGVVIRNKNFEWDLYANLTTNRNRITELVESRKTQTAYSLDDNGQVNGEYKGYSSGNYYFTEGQSRYTYYTKKYYGVYNEQTYKTTYKSTVADADKKYDATLAGQALYYINETDDAGNVIGTYTTTNGSSADYYVIGDVLPKVYGGFGTGFKYKGFDLSVDFTYQLGGKVFDSEYQSLMSFDAGYGYHKDLLDAWTPENSTSDIPRLNVGDKYSVSTSDRFLTSAKCLTLQNVTFGYSLPKEALSKLHLTKLRIYFVGDNLFTWSARKGLDPRMSVTGGSSGLYYSSIRTLSAGVQVGF